MKPNVKGFLIGLSISILVLASALGGALADRLFGIKPLDSLFARTEENGFRLGSITQRVLNEESVVVDVVENNSPSVVTVSIKTPRRRVLEFNPFGGGISSRFEGGKPQDIGTGFVVGAEGLIITNKHVVSDLESSYEVITSDDKTYEVIQISRDPSNDIAILKIDPSAGSGQELQPVELGSSSQLKVGQFVIAIGTALGEFRHTVTTGVISGLGRGITAGSAFEGFVERLDDVIQTDAAINPGNSGGPLLNSAGQVVGVNVAVAQGAENVGFAIPIDIVKDALAEFEKTGKFASKPYLGVQYQMVSQQAAVLNNVPQGAYIIEVVFGSPADEAGVKSDDIIVKIDGTELTEKNGGLSGVISGKKTGQSVTLEVWRDLPSQAGGETKILQATLSGSGE